MKKYNLSLAIFVLILAGLVMPTTLSAQRYNDRSNREERLTRDSRMAKQDFMREDPSMQSLFDNSYGYVIFPNVGKGGFGLGAAAGTGIVYERGNMIGKASMKQLNVGFQAGGQVYREVIFFRNRGALDRFREGNFELSARSSAVAVKNGASMNPRYRNGVTVFTQEKSGFMVEASVGGQRFDYAAL